MSWTQISKDARQHCYGVPMDHVIVATATLARIVAVGWRFQGRCAEDTTGAWFAQLGSRATRRAKVACTTCPVRKTCLGSALLHGEEFGVWGGFDPTERVPLDAALRAGTSLEDLLDDVLEVRHAAG